MIKKFLDFKLFFASFTEKKMLISRVELAALLLAVWCGAMTGWIVMDEYEPEQSSGFAALEEDVGVENENIITCFSCFFGQCTSSKQQQGIVPLNLISQLHSRKD